jgi:hypothetical protein
MDYPCQTSQGITNYVSSERYSLLLIDLLKEAFLCVNLSKISHLKFEVPTTNNFVSNSQISLKFFSSSSDIWWYLE